MPGNLDRRNYYGYTGVPNVCVDGVYVNVSDSYAQYRLRFDERKVIPSPIALSVTLQDYDNSTGVGHVRAVATNMSGATGFAYLRFVAVGDDTVGTWGGFSYLSHTALHVFPNGLGVAASLPPNGIFETTQEFQIPTSWRHKPCTIIAFAQRDDTKEVLQATILHEVVLGLSSELQAGQLVLDWPGISGATLYRVHGTVNGPYFVPAPGNLVATLPAGTTTWSTPAGIGDPATNWTYRVIALDASSDVLTMSGRSGEFDFSVDAR
ncbi:MAG: hypothetical protein MUE60_14710 [Candidatus Eisenbacteria bacterium]|nr:hypothetical protein [Candidatus Eisenbacteria bacterium]